MEEALVILAEKIEWLDGTFDLLLVLLGIITSVLFWFQCTRIPREADALIPDTNRVKS